jgi:hypothetical protein
VKPDPLVVDAYVVDALMADLVGRERSPSAFLVYLYLWRQGTKESVRVSLQHIAAGTGLSKSSVQGAIRLLTRRRLIRAEHASPTAVPEYFVERPWKRRLSPRSPAAATRRPRGRRG